MIKLFLTKHLKMKKMIFINIRYKNIMIENKKKEFNRYENSKIYKLIDPDSGYYYIGSSCGPLTQRLCKHKSYASIKPEIKIYKCFNQIRWNNVKIMGQ